jgi:hypothetical protein
MSRARDRRKKREREAWYWGNRAAHVLKRSGPWLSLDCTECHGSGRAPDHALRVLQDAQRARDAAIGIYHMCRKCGGTGKVRSGMLHFNVTI